MSKNKKIQQKATKKASKQSKIPAILAIDQGTTGTKVLVVDQKFRILAEETVEFRQYYPNTGWVEHDLEDIWKSTQKAIQRALTKKTSSHWNIVSLGIANQRETICFWNKKSGAPLTRAIVWQDRRTTQLCNRMIAEGLDALISKKTGLVIDPYFSASKIMWALENNQDVRRAASKGELACGTIDSYVVSRLTKNRSHFTEHSNASRTMLYNIETLRWDDELLKLFRVPEHCLPEVLDSNSNFGKTLGVYGLADGIPIHGVLGDQQAALLGQACIKPGMAKCTYGTGSFILMNTGGQIKRSRHRQLSTVAWCIGKRPTYALEGASFIAGAAVQWLRDGLGIIKKSEEIEKLALRVPSSDGVIFVPALAGLGAPYWVPEARGAFYGLTRGATKSHLARAVLEGIAFTNYDILKSMESDLGSAIQKIAVDGGASKNNLLMQFQCDLLNTELIRPKTVHTTALGAVFMAGLGSGLWSDLNDIQKGIIQDQIFSPRMSQQNRTKVLESWHSAINATKQICY